MAHGKILKKCEVITMYVCSKCKKDIASLDTKFTRCPYCGHRILYKRREPIAKEVSTD